MEQNKCTLLIDGNWLLMSRATVLLDKFNKNNNPYIIKSACLELKDLLAKAISVILNRFAIIDNIILVSDCGSWRKQLIPPKILKNITYKGNRVKNIEYDWDKIFQCLNELNDTCKELNITTCNYNLIEGDDWIWYWSKKLNANGINCIIWSIDNDLKQLIQYDNNCFTAWYNDRNGLWLHEKLNIQDIDNINFFINPIYISPVLENIKIYAKKSINYINPDNILLTKIICGDNSDNIKPVAKFIKNNKIYKITNKDWEIISKELKIYSIQDLLDNQIKIGQYIKNYKKFIKYDLNIKDILDIIQYNIKLIWLNENIIPEILLNTMNNIDYKIYDVKNIKYNYKILTNDDNDIKNIYESINF